jgi:hypothetical protein
MSRSAVAVWVATLALLFLSIVVLTAFTVTFVEAGRRGRAETTDVRTSRHAPWQLDARGTTRS